MYVENKTKLLNNKRTEDKNTKITKSTDFFMPSTFTNIKTIFFYFYFIFSLPISANNSSKITRRELL